MTALAFLGVTFIGLVTLWIVLAGLIVVLWRVARNKLGNTRIINAIFTVAALAWLASVFWYGGGIKLYYNAKVDSLCAIDGGVKVYETVKLPPEKFDKWEQIDFFRPTQNENALGPEYLFKWERTYVRKGNPAIVRQHFEVIRRTDGKLLGETTLYQRGGGDLPLPGSVSGYDCPSAPEAAGSNALFKQVFIKSA